MMKQKSCILQLVIWIGLCDFLSAYFISAASFLVLLMGRGKQLYKAL